MASKRQIDVGGVLIGGGAPVAVQSMTKTETADFDSTMRQIRAIADAGAHRVRLNPGNIGGPEKTAEVVAKAKEHGTPIRVGVNSGSLPKHLHELERENSVEALVQAAVEFVELMERLDFHDFKVSIKSTNVPNTIASNRLLSQKI